MALRPSLARRNLHSKDPCNCSKGSDIFATRLLQRWQFRICLKAGFFFNSLTLWVHCEGKIGMFFSQLISRLLDFNIERLEGLQLLICNLSMFIPSWAGARARWWSISTQIYGVWASKMEPSLPPTKVTLCHNANWYPTLVQYSQWTECTSWYRFPHQWHHSKHPNVLQNFVHHSHFCWFHGHRFSFPGIWTSINPQLRNFVAQASWELVTTRTPRLSRPFWCSQICRPSAEKSWEMYEEKKKTQRTAPPSHSGKRSFTHFFW